MLHAYHKCAWFIYLFLGYETDDEYEDNEDMRYVRRNKGKKYASVPSDEGSEKSAYRTFSEKVSSDLSSSSSLGHEKDTCYKDGLHSAAHGAPNSSSCARTSTPARHYSGSQGSSEDSASDEAESPSNSTTAYVNTPAPRGTDLDYDKQITNCNYTISHMLAYTDTQCVYSYIS